MLVQFLCCIASGPSGDDELAALRLLECHGAVQGVDGDGESGHRTGGWVVIRCSHSPGAVMAASTPRRLAAKRITS